MAKRWVVNASPLIVLGKVGQLGLLSKLSDELVIPGLVAAEVNVGGKADNAQRWIAKEARQYLEKVEQFDPVIAGWDLGAGETSVLTFARQHSGFEALLDDRAARNCAMALQIPVRGTLGIVLLAKREGILSETRPVIEALEQAGLHLDAKTVQTILKLAGE